MLFSMLLGLSLVSFVVSDDTTGCATDAGCTTTGTAYRCCPVQGRAENCPQRQLPLTGSHPCVLPGTIGASNCTCSVSSGCGTYAPNPMVPGLKQWLMIGDSISGGVNAYIRAHVNLTEEGIQLQHVPVNAANVWFGLHCLDTWAAETDRWDVVTFNFGLHDLALDNERLEPPFYQQTLDTFTQKLQSTTSKKKSKLVWVTTTPVPNGIAGACNKTTGQGGCPPRRVADPPIYNEAAANVMKKYESIETLDLYGLVTKKCGTNYTLCPENCDSWPGHNGTIPCFSRPYNVHYNQPGWEALTNAYISVVKK
eukprot:m.8171 g.8171  ORF g.8171 m.8171 type:complete len:310 (+) comp3850_c0_seq2:113-1042(+)